MDHDALGDGITEEDVSEMIKILDKAKIPDTIPDKKIKIATWNIRNFGGSRENIYIHHIAEVLNRFNLIATIELKDNTEDLEKVMKILGPYWKVIYSDTNMDQKGNKERIGYLYDGRIIEFTNLAAEADPIRENFATKERLTDRINSYNRIKKEEKKELIEILKKIKSSDEIKHYVRVEEFVERIETDYESSRLKHIVKRMRKSGTFMETQNWWRSPYLVSFKAGNFDFVMLAAHLRWGDHESERKDALEELADWIKKRRELTHIIDKDMFVLGDFNIPKIDDELWKAITKHGLQTHENILCDDHGSGFKEGKRYDQIFYHSENEHKIEDGGILNLYPKGRREPFKDIPKSKFEYKISDHFPLWIQVNVE